MLYDRRSDLVERAAALTTSAVADALDRCGAWGALPTALHHLGGRRERFFGQAVTVHWSPVRKSSDIRAAGPSTWSEVRDFLLPEIEDGRGLVYVGGSGPLCTEMALAGGLSCTYFEALGFEGVVLGGGVRDTDMIAALDMPVLASNVCCPDTQGSYCVTETGGETLIDNQRVVTGDWILADTAGVVTIPDRLIEQVFSEAETIEAAESHILSRIRAGERLCELVDRQGGHI